MRYETKISLQIKWKAKVWDLHMIIMISWVKHGGGSVMLCACMVPLEKAH